MLALEMPGFHDIALRDFGLFVAAVALALLATQHAPRHPLSSVNVLTCSWLEGAR